MKLDLVLVLSGKDNVILLAESLICFMFMFYNLFQVSIKKPLIISMIHTKLFVAQFDMQSVLSRLHKLSNKCPFRVIKIDQITILLLSLVFVKNAKN